MSRKSYASLAALPSLFARSTRDFESQATYISNHWLTCSHDHENLFDWRKLLNPRADEHKDNEAAFHHRDKINDRAKRWIAVSKPYSPQRERQ